LQRQFHLARPSLLRAGGALWLALISSACADSLRPFGPTPAVATAHAEQFFEAFTTRFLPNELSPSYELARVRLAQSALTPSRVFNDTSVWDWRPSATLRALFVSGEPVDGGKYRLDTRTALTPPARPGETRHTITLEQLEPNVYRWDTRMDLAIGAATADEMGTVLMSLFAAAEGKNEGELRSDYRAAFPHAAVAFGHGFSVDSLHVAPGGQGTTNVALVGSFRPELMRPIYPELARYLDKYVGPAKYHFLLADRSGNALFDLSGANRSMALRWRVHQGKLMTLFGAPRPWPDTLVLTSDLTLRVKLFTVGFQGMVSEFAISNSGHDRGWTIISRQEPKWVLPMITERVLRSPLHRPFEGAGSMVRLSVRDSAGAQSVVSRHTRLDVQESAIMRFMGSLAARAIGDLDTRVEAEEDRFLRDGFAALAADLRSLAPRWREKPLETP
jgi:hypothetical protein